MSHRLRVLLVLFYFPLLGFAESDETPTLRVPRVSRAPKLSDFLNGTPREAEVEVSDFRQMEPDDGQPASQPTTAYLSYDDKRLYAVFVAKDDPKLIRARVAKRKQILDDDRVTINIDTFNDHSHANFFDVNPYGVQMDGVATDGLADDMSWEALWYSEAKITEDGYVVMISIPFKTLRFPNTPKQTWGVALGRLIRRNNEFSLWPWVSRKKTPQYVAQFGHMELENVSPGRNVQVIPYGLVSRSRFLDRQPDAIPAMKTETDWRGGVDAKMVLKDALTLDMTLNPDFSQVESDEPQVTVNQRYEVFFEEKRPFFMENASYFKTPATLFFSRRIADPEYGVRLTGKLGRWGLGVLATDDRAPGEAVAENDPNRGRRAMAGVVSVQRDLLQDSHVRFLGTDREWASGHNRVASLDTRLNLGNKFFFLGQAATALTNPTGQSGYSGNYYYGRIQRYDGKLDFFTQFTDVSPAFHTDLGFIPRTDIREFKTYVGYKWWREKSTLVNFGPALMVLGNWNREGRNQDWEVDFDWNMQLLRQTYLQFSREEKAELYQGVAFRKSDTNFWAETQWWKWMEIEASYGVGDGANYYPAAGLPPFLGRFRRAELELTLYPTKRLQLEEKYIHDGLTTSFGRQKGTVSVYNNHIVRSKANYQFNRKASVRTIVDYNGVLPNESLVEMERAKRVTYDFLFTYLVHPGTALHVGYTDIYENLQLDPLRPPYLTLAGAPDLNTGRQVFVKVSYLFRF